MIRSLAWCDLEGWTAPRGGLFASPPRGAVAGRPKADGEPALTAWPPAQAAAQDAHASRSGTEYRPVNDLCQAARLIANP